MWIFGAFSYFQWCAKQNINQLLSRLFYSFALHSMWSFLNHFFFPISRCKQRSIEWFLNERLSCVSNQNAEHMTNKTPFGAAWICWFLMNSNNVSKSICLSFIIFGNEHLKNYSMQSERLKRWVWLLLTGNENQFGVFAIDWFYLSGFRRSWIYFIKDTAAATETKPFDSMRMWSKCLFLNTAHKGLDRGLHKDFKSPIGSLFHYIFGWAENWLRFEIYKYLKILNFLQILCYERSFSFHRSWSVRWIFALNKSVVHWPLLILCLSFHSILFIILRISKQNLTTFFVDNFIYFFFHISTIILTARMNKIVINGSIHSK